ncbi:MAG: VOC family protein [Alphaproteobacteria bacterium]
MYSHVTIGTDDIEQGREFYDAVLGTIGLVRRWNFPSSSGYAAKGQARPQFWIMKPFDEDLTRPGNGIMPGFLAPDRAAVDAFWRAALAKGGLDEGPPGRRPHYHVHYYGCYVRDPLGNKLCACCHEPYPGDDEVSASSR